MIPILYYVYCAVITIIFWNTQNQKHVPIGLFAFCLNCLADCNLLTNLYKRTQKQIIVVAHNTINKIQNKVQCNNSKTSRHLLLEIYVPSSKKLRSQETIFFNKIFCAAHVQSRLWLLVPKIYAKNFNLFFALRPSTFSPITKQHGAFKTTQHGAFKTTTTTTTIAVANYIFVISDFRFLGPL